MHKSLVLVSLLLFPLFSSYAQTPEPISSLGGSIKNLANLIEKNHYDKALEELDWIKLQISKNYLRKVVDSLPKKIGKYSSTDPIFTPSDQTYSSSISGVSMPYTNEAEAVTCQVTPTYGEKQREQCQLERNSYGKMEVMRVGGRNVFIETYPETSIQSFGNTPPIENTTVRTTVTVCIKNAIIGFSSDGKGVGSKSEAYLFFEQFDLNGFEAKLNQ